MKSGRHKPSSGQPAVPRVGNGFTFLRRNTPLLLGVCVRCLPPETGYGSDRVVPGRTREGLLVLYEFGETEGGVVHDRAGIGDPVDLQIADLEAVHRSPGSLTVHRATRIRPDGPARRISQAIRRSGACTVEAWVRPAMMDQTGPARIVTLSKNASERNLTLGQEQDTYDVRFRTQKTSVNGLPSVQGAGRPGLTHVMYTRKRNGQTRLYLNGREAEEAIRNAPLGNWDSSALLCLANELQGDRPWLGTYHLVAVFARALSPEKVRAHYQVGASSGGDTSLLWEVVELGDMPQDRPPLSDEEKAWLREWIRDGADWTLDQLDPAVYAHGGSDGAFDTASASIPHTQPVETP